MNLSKSVGKICNAVARQGLGRAREVLGAPPQYEIRGGYKHRGSYKYFDDATQSAVEYQREVYDLGAILMQEEGLNTVYDVGCGSAMKLMRAFQQYDTTGFDVPETVSYLHRRYPQRKWASVPFSNRSYLPGDLVICADVIEHVLDPDELMSFLVSLTNRWLILSTPDRKLLYKALSGRQFGPPANPHHIREWTYDEFGRYARRFVDVRKHTIANRAQGTQMILAKLRG
jgi:hypothetical protein